MSSYGSGSTSYGEFDAAFSTEALLDDTASVTDRYRYRAFGLAAQTQGTSTQPHQFVGKRGYYNDSELGLYWVRRRPYDPDTGRWLSEDRSGYKGGDLNLYRYCFNDPVNQTDPSGNKIFVGEGDITRCAKGGLRSDVTDRLRDEIYTSATVPWPTDSSENQWTSAGSRSFMFSGTANRNERIYGTIDGLGRRLPPIFWSYLKENKLGGCAAGYRKEFEAQLTGERLVTRDSSKSCQITWQSKFPAPVLLPPATARRLACDAHAQMKGK